MTTVAKLYEHCDTLDSAGELTEEHNKLYQEIISGSKGEAIEKRLSCQLIVRYFSKFPSLHDEALDAMFDLCKDDDVNIRKHVIKEFPNLCKEPGRPHIAKIAEVLVKLLPADDVISENQAVQSALQTILKAHMEGLLTTSFGHILNAEEDLLRERAVRFLVPKLFALGPTLTKEFEEFVIEESKKFKVSESDESERSFSSATSMGDSTVTPRAGGQAAGFERASKTSLKAFISRIRGITESGKDKISVDDRKILMDAVDGTSKWLDGNRTAEKEEFEQKQKELEGVCNPILKALSSIFTHCSCYMDMVRRKGTSSKCVSCLLRGSPPVKRRTNADLKLVAQGLPLSSALGTPGRPLNKLAALKARGEDLKGYKTDPKEKEKNAAGGPLQLDLTLAPNEMKELKRQIPHGESLEFNEEKTG